MKALLFVCEAGIALIDDSFRTVSSKKFLTDPVYRTEKLLGGESTQEFLDLLQDAKKKSVETVLVHDPRLFPAIARLGLAVKVMDTSTIAQIEKERLSLIVSSGFANDLESARSLVSGFALERAVRRIREYGGRPDRHVAQSVSCVEELDKTSNLLWGRLKEWYSLHFPELADLVPDPQPYAMMVMRVGRRELFTFEALADFNLTQFRTDAIIQASRESKGAHLRDEDLAQISRLAEAYLDLDGARKKMSDHVSKTMQLVAPNVTGIVGALVGAKLIAKAGSLERLALLPSSTIQVLGAEKALFRSLKTGTRPPKHGILFQHPFVHSGPKWQRGKIARVLANATAIAARIDLYRGELEESISEKLNRKISEIKAKYPKPPLEQEKSVKRRVKKSRKT